MTLSLAPLTDLSTLAGALIAANLPATDIDCAGRRFWSCRDAGGQIVGYAGLEPRGDDGLLRSVVILPRHRGRGIGHGLISLMTETARAQNIQRLWLLTLDAENFFARSGFARVDRASAPTVIASSREFAALCPANAVCMTKTLSAVP